MVYKPTYNWGGAILYKLWDKPPINWRFIKISSIHSTPQFWVAEFMVIHKEFMVSKALSKKNGDMDGD